MIDFKNRLFYTPNQKIPALIFQSMERVIHADWPIVVSTHIKNIYKEIMKAAEFYQDGFYSLFKKYAYKDEDGKFVDEAGKEMKKDTWALDKNQMDKFNEELEMLLDMDIQIAKEPVYISKIPEKFRNEIKVKPIDLAILDFMIKE
jgi:hypothetical protein